MAYDELLAMRVRDALGGQAVEKRMMGGLIFMVNGHMLAGVDNNTGQGRLMFRVGPAAMSEALSRPGSEAVTMGGRTMKGFVFVPESDAVPVLGEWIALARRFVDSLPPK